MAVRRYLRKFKKHWFYYLRMPFPKFKRRFLSYYIQMPYRIVTAKRRSLPDFLIIGTQKGGSTALFYLLAQHPQINTSTVKEVRYFSSESNYKKGQLWYRAHFPLQDAIAPGELIGEATPGYLFHPAASKRITKEFPNAKLICVLRNPTERAISQYFMHLRQKVRRPSIKEAMLAEGSPRRFYKKRGLYLEQLQRYERYRKNHQLLILSSEEFLANPQEVLKQVFEFLGIDKTFECSDLSRKNVGRNKTPVPREVYEYLDEYFKPHNKRLYSYLGRDFGW